ncbi:MAG: NADP(H)-dependent aldo-keto reductase [Hyphomicrobiaceae bacterium]|nr:NADP(H)-dependent aldo-keto reductase [Hyphomicrobiaceae bacterium]
MEKRQLGHSDLRVSKLCLGTMTWGEQNSEREGHEQMDYALDQGVNFFDTAELYPIPPKADTQGRTEKIIGTWMKARANREQIVLASKICGRTLMNWFRKDGGGCEVSPAQIREAIEGSLLRLQTDFIDLYQVHWPDRPMRTFGGLGFEPGEGDTHDMVTILQTMQELVVEGKIRHVGLSNETPFGVMSCLKTAKMFEVPRVVSVQNAYNLLNRSFETGLSEITHYEGVGLLAYSPLAQGYLTGKYQNGALPKGSRKQLFARLERYETPGADVAMEKYLEIAARFELDPAQMALQFVTTRPFVTSNIIGATSMEQLKSNIASVDVPLGEEVLKEIEQVHLVHSNPCP